MSALALQQLSNTATSFSQDRHRHPFYLSATKSIKKLKITINLHSCEAYKRNGVKVNRCKEFEIMLQLCETQCLSVHERRICAPRVKENTKLRSKSPLCSEYGRLLKGEEVSLDPKKRWCEDGVSTFVQ